MTISVLNKIYNFLSEALSRAAAAEISRITRYYDAVLQVEPLSHDDGSLLNNIAGPQKRVVASIAALPDLSNDSASRTVVLLNGNINHEIDISRRLRLLWPKLSRSSRVVEIAYNPYLKWLYGFCNYLGLRKGQLPSTFVTRTALENLAALSGFKVVRLRPICALPEMLGGAGRVISGIVTALPFLHKLFPISVIVLRPVKRAEKCPSISVIVPVRNEKENVKPTLDGLSRLAMKNLQVLFIEGNSTDGTWDELGRLSGEYAGTLNLVCLKQKGTGKADAVTLGFDSAKNDLLCILDGDLSVPIERLQEFFDAWVCGHGDFVNGNRLVYPLESSAMAFLNRLGNVFFAKSVASVLDIPIGDSLCGTKVLERHDWLRFKRWRDDFGAFDPFGDFDLLFPAAQLALGVVEVPTPYRRRQYGRTNIHRFRDGFQLLKMVAIGQARIKTYL